MKRVFESLKQPQKQGEALIPLLEEVLTADLSALEECFVQDLSHISQAASYAGEMRIDQIIYLKESLYRCDYSYAWQIAWTCSGTQEVGRVSEKVRFTVSEAGEVDFKFLKLES